MDIDPARIPLWIRRADRRRRLLALGVSLDEQSRTSTRMLDEILAVDSTYNEAEKDSYDRQSQEAERGKFGGGR
jgi:hypothetical protein